MRYYGLLLFAASAALLVVWVPPPQRAAEGPHPTGLPDSPGGGSANKVRARILKSEAVRELLQAGKENSVREAGATQGMGVRSVKFQHFYRGLEVIGSVITYHEGPAGEQVYSELARFDLDTHPTLTRQDAESLAASYLDKNATVTVPALKILPSRDRRSARLVFQVETAGQGIAPKQEVLIDARTGALVAKIARNDSIPGKGTP